VAAEPGGRDVDRDEISHEMNRVRSEFHELIDIYRGRGFVSRFATGTARDRASMVWTPGPVNESAPYLVSTSRVSSLGVSGTLGSSQRKQGADP
jgi:hypothetical protein